jgi:hypothetical protein
VREGMLFATASPSTSQSWAQAAGVFGTPLMNALALAGAEMHHRYTGR